MCFVLQDVRLYLSYLLNLGRLLGVPEDITATYISFTLAFISNLQRVVTPLQKRQERRMLFYKTTIEELQVGMPSSMKKAAHILSTSPRLIGEGTGGAFCRGQPEIAILFLSLLESPFPLSCHSSLLGLVIPGPVVMLPSSHSALKFLSLCYPCLLSSAWEGALC